MKIIAWVVLVATVIAVLAVPLLFGKAREPWGYKDFYHMVVNAAWTIPMCGRILGWW